MNGKRPNDWFSKAPLPSFLQFPSGKGLHGAECYSELRHKWISFSTSTRLFFLREQRSLILQNELRLRTEFPRDPRRPLQSSRPGSNPSSTTFRLRGGGTSFWTSASSFGNWKRGWGEWQQWSGSAEARGRLPSWYHRCLICLGLVAVSPPSRPWALPEQPGDDRARRPSEVAPWPRVAGVSSGAPGTPCLWRVGQVIRVS